MRFPSAFLSIEQFADNSDAIREFFDNPRLEEDYPGAKEEMAQIVSMESYINRLVDFDMRLRGAGGMNRGLAAELHELVPDLEGFNPRAYTEDVTQIRYMVSLEEISGKMWALIAAGAAIIIGMIVKFIGWITGGSSGGGGGGGSSSLSEAKEGVKLAETNTKATAKVMHEAQAVVNKTRNKTVTVEVPAVQNHQTVQHSHMPQPLKDQVVRKTRDLKDRGTQTSQDAARVEIEIRVMAELADIMKTNSTSPVVPDNDSRILFSRDRKVIDMLVDSFKLFGVIGADTMKTIAILDELIAASAAQGEDLSEALESEVNKKQDELKKLREGMVAKLKFGDESAKSLMEWSITLTHAISRARDVEIPEQFEVAFQTCGENFDRLADVDWESLEQMFEILSKGEEALKRSEQAAKEYGKITQVERPMGRPDLVYHAHNLKVSQHMISMSMNALMNVYSTLSRVYSESGRTVYLLLKGFGGYIQKVIDFHKKYEQEPPADLARIHEEIEGQLAKMRDHPIHRRFLSEHAWKHFAHNK